MLLFNNVFPLSEGKIFRLFKKDATFSLPKITKEITSVNASGEDIVFYLQRAFGKTSNQLERRIETILRRSIENLLQEANTDFSKRVKPKDANLKVKQWRAAILEVPSNFGSREPTKTVVDDLVDNLNRYLEEIWSADERYDRSFVNALSFPDFIFNKNPLACAQLATRSPFKTIGRIFMNVSPPFRQHMYIRQTSDTDVPRYAVSILEFHNQKIGDKYFEFFTLITSRSAGTGDGRRVLYMSAGDVLGSRDVLICLCCLQSAAELDVEALLQTNPSRVLSDLIWFDLLFEETETIRTFNLKGVQANCYSGVAFIKDTDHSTAISPAFTIPISERKGVPLEILHQGHRLEEVKTIINEYKDPTTGSDYSRVIEDFLLKNRSTISH